MARNQSYALVHLHIGKEYLLSFVVAFFFFFFIFFINQILLVAQKILLKNVDFPSVFQLILLSIPQFLLYTFPFSALTASSMVIGDLSGSNEILAIRSSGISIRHVWLPIVAIAILFSCLTLFTADVALPWSMRQYKTLYSQLMRDLPTIELDSNSSNTIGKKVLVNGAVQGSEVKDIILFDISSNQEGQVLSSPQGTVTLVDLNNFIYRLDLEKPVILDTNTQDINSWSLSKAEKAIFYLDFSGQVAALATASPSQLSLSDLRANIAKYRETYFKDYDRYEDNLRDMKLQLANYSKNLDRGELPVNTTAAFNQVQKNIKLETNDKPVNFYYQYYRAELNKKYALSAACFMLVFLTFSLSFFKVKHGRLIGFGLSMLVAVLYWYLLFFAQLKVFSFALNPAFLIWAPDVFFFSLGVLFLSKARRS
jgi:lipopolysaccharide export system permease protein